MFKYFLILSLLFSGRLQAQEDPTPSQAEKMADSILNQFKTGDDKDFNSVSKEEQEKLIAAEDKHMNEFLMLERDKEDTKKFKTYLQITIGSFFLLLFIIVYRNSKRKKVQER